MPDLEETDGLVFRTVEEAEAEGLPIVDMTVVDEERFPGRTFTGTVEKIVEEMKMLQPGIFDNSNVTEAAINALALEKRQASDDVS